MSSALIDPEAPDDSEEQFAVSLDMPAPPPRYSRIIMPESELRAEQFAAAVHQNISPARGEVAPPEGELAFASQTAFRSADDPDIWRQEVASRVESYRAKRRRRGMPTREPSLHLDFEARAQLENPRQEPLPEPEPQAEPEPQPAREIAVNWDGTVVGAVAPQLDPRPPEMPEEESNLIEFPGPILDLPTGYELAEPVVVAPRILDAPEEVEQAVPTAMADITLEDESEAETADTDIEVPLQVAPLPQRVFGGIVDFLFILAAIAIFGEVVFKICQTVAFSKPALAAGLALPCFFWLLYQYLFLVYAGHTPGMRVARVGLVGFEGEPVSQPQRRWRALAMVLSCISLGMGFVWALADEDTLTWHDRMTRTYTAEVRGNGSR